MKATVGPLPPAVYWRRRAIVIGALVVLVILLVAMCSSGGNKGKPNARRSGAAPNGSTTATPSPTVLPPIVGESAPSGGGGNGGDGDSNPTTSSSAGGGDNGGAGGQQQASVGGCADSDISLTAEATPLAGGGFQFLMKVKNTSSHACTRDVGGGPQELVVTGPSGSWSSNSCAAPGASPAPDVRTFQPGVEATLPAPSKPFAWDGSINKCSGGTKAGAGTYHLVAKLATKSSDPTPVVIGK